MNPFKQKGTLFNPPWTPGGVGFASCVPPSEILKHLSSPVAPFSLLFGLRLPDRGTNPKKATLIQGARLTPLDLELRVSGLRGIQGSGGFRVSGF